MSLISLPEEVLVEVFKYLRYTDILSVSLVCKFFKDIVDSSPILLSTLPRISFTERKSHLEWIDTQKYTKFLVDAAMAERFLSEISSVTYGSIRVLTLGFGSTPVPYQTLAKILKTCPSLSEVRIVATNVVPSEGAAIEAPQLELEKLDFYGNAVAFRIFSRTMTKCLKLRHCNDSALNAFTNFLGRQTKLVELKLYSFSRFFIDNQLDTVAFRLRKIAFINTPGIETSEHFRAFIANHTDSLEHLQVKFHEGVLDSFTSSSFRCLRSLKLDTLPTNKLTPMLQIERLTGKNLRGNFVEKFPNLRHLVLTDSVSQYWVTDLSRLTSLTSLAIDDTSVNSLVLPPPVRSLRLTSASLFEKHFLDFQRAKLDHLSIDYCENIDFLDEFLGSCGGVKRLVITNSSLSERCLLAVENGRHMVERLVMANCHVASGVEQGNSMLNLAYSY